MNKELYEKDVKLLSLGEYKELNINGMECIIFRHRFGHLCGYVITNKRLDNIVAYTLNVHGGITFNGMLFLDGMNKYAVGFDCAADGDYIHYVDSKYNVLPFEEYTYRDIEYVTNELQRLTEQLKDINYRG